MVHLPTVLCWLTSSVAAAFLVVPDIAEADRELLSIASIVTPGLRRAITLPCPGWPVPPSVPNVDGSAPPRLELNFSVDRDAAGSDRLLVNGFELYPHTDPLHLALSARIAFGEGDTVSHTDALQLGFQLTISKPVPGAEDHTLEALDVSLQVIEIAGVFVHGIPTVRIKLVRNGRSLAIADMDVDEPDPPQGPERKECVGFLCKWMALVSDRLGRSHGRAPCGRRKGYTSTDRHGFSHDAWHSHRGLAGTIMYLTSHIIVPLFLGIMAGVGLGVIVLVTGTALAGAFSSIRGRSSLRNSGKTITDDGAREDASLLNNQDPPPTYEEESHKVESSSLS